MNKSKAIGLVIFAGALGMFCTMVSVDVGQLQTWETASNPGFVGKIIGYFGTVLTAFAAGKIMPNGEGE